MAEIPEDTDNIIELTDEDGNVVPFELLDLLEYEGNQYAVLVPADDEDAECEAEDIVILKAESGAEDDEYTTYASVEDEAVEDAVFELFREKYAEDFDFTE